MKFLDVTNFLAVDIKSDIKIIHFFNIGPIKNIDIIKKFENGILKAYKDYNDNNSVVEYHYIKNMVYVEHEDQSIISDYYFKFDDIKTYTERQYKLKNILNSDI